MPSRSTLQLSGELRQQQSLSPLQVRYGRMLEMSGPEIEEAVRTELDDNPALELADGTERWEANERTPRYSTQSVDVDEARVVASESSLAEHLERQLGETSLGADPHMQLVAEYVIGSLDTNGYLTRTPQAIAGDIALAEGVDTDAAEVQRAIDIIRSLDPAGVGATSLRDCLMLQLDRIADTDSSVVVARKIVGQHFELLSKMHWDRLRQALGVDRETLSAALDRIRSLNPKPGSAFGATKEQGVAADFHVEADPDGTVHLTVLNSVPELRLSESFAPDASLPKEPQSRRDAKAGIDFIRNKRGEAEAFMRILRMRQSTLFAVMSAIVSLQKQFFVTEDPADLRPMVIRDIAALTGYDASVISRSTAGKYVSTPTAIYPLRYLFNEAPVSDRTEVSRHAVHDALRSIIEAEDPSHPLPDDALAEALAARGFAIARRTVAKYREQMGYPVARLRKKI